MLNNNTKKNQQVMVPIHIKITELKLRSPLKKRYHNKKSSQRE